VSGSKFVILNPGTLPDDGGKSFAFKASSAFGGVTIISAYAVTGAVGTLDLVLLNGGTAGSSSGTIAHMADGTATVWAADTPQALTITAAQAYLDAGEWLVLKKVESAADNDLSADAAIMIELVDGIVTQG
jgi:hypothetical protein